MSDTNLENITETFIAEGMAGIKSQLDSCPADGDHRLRLLDSIRKAVDAVYIENELLDRMHEIYDACIAESLTISDGDEKLIAYANVTSYNLAANLADCWQDAKETRSAQHFNAGVKAANRCLDLRVQLNKPPAAMAMAYFILGVHEYSLQHYSQAEQAWLNKQENEITNGEQSSQNVSNLDVLLSSGLIGLARWSMGTEDDTSFQQSISLLEAERTTENGGEIDLFIDELKLLKQRHGPEPV